jgi:UDP-N-acetylmuramate--alanine ligase
MSGWNNRIISIFEPHLYSRTKDFHKGFAEALSLSDYVIIAKIYGAREKPLPNITSQLIIDELLNMNYKKSIYIENKNDIIPYLKKIISKNDMILCMGAGQINSIVHEIIIEVEKKYEY